MKGYAQIEGQSTQGSDKWNCMYILDMYKQISFSYK